MKRDDLERRMDEAAREYNEPPEPPRDEMWAVIRQSLPTGRSPEAGRSEGVIDMAARRDRRWWSRSRASWGIGLAAAALAVGFGLGRIVDPAPSGTRGAAATSGRAAPEAAASLPVRVAAAGHMGEAEALLTLFRTGETAADRAATAEWARDLLSQTRLMLDSRAADDPELLRLLEDLELVLAQIAGAPGNPDEQDLIEAGIEERQLLTKLRTAAAPVDYAL